MNIYRSIRELANSIKIQNLFCASKEIGNLKLFKNDSDLSKLQDIYLSWIITFDAINRDIIIDGISKHVCEDEIYTDAYLLWKREKKYKQEEKDKKQKDLNLIAGNKIIFPKR